MKRTVSRPVARVATHLGLVVARLRALGPLAVCALAAVTCAGRELALDTSYARYSLGANGLWTGIRKSGGGRSLVAGAPLSFSVVNQGGKFYPATSLREEGGLWRARYGESGVEADFRIASGSNYIVFKLTRVGGGDIREFRILQVRPACREWVGTLLGVVWDREFAVNLLGLSDRVEVAAAGDGTLRASVYPEFRMVGEGVALVAAPTPRLLAVVREVEEECGLPSPRIHGRWAKESEDVRTSYLFTDLTEANAAETIRYAKLGGFKYILIYSSTWSTSLGSYPINPLNFPGGEASLRSTVDRCHAAGLKVGMHMLTSAVGKDDKLVRPVPDPRLLKDDEATLEVALDQSAGEITAREALTGFPREGAFYGAAKAGQDVQIDGEMIGYRAVGGPATNVLLGCRRGINGTKASPHPAGAKMHHLAERYGYYLADLRTPLKDEIAERIAGLINRCGFDMIYLDGGECNEANGPYWYWVGQQQEAIFGRVKRDLLVQGSGTTHWTWHWFSRGCCDDFAAVAPKEYLDYHKIADSWAYYRRNFLPAELGWWGFLAEDPAHPATVPDEVELYGARMLALDTPVSLETSLAALRRNGRTEECLKLLGDYEGLRLRNAVPAAVRGRLEAGEWGTRREKGEWALAPVRYPAQRVELPGTFTVTNGFGEQALKFRLRAVTKLAPPHDGRNVVLAAPAEPVGLGSPGPGVLMPGALIRRVELGSPAGEGAAAKPLNLVKHRALAATLRVKATRPFEAGSCPVLNLQLEASAKQYRDYYVDLDFTGEKTVVIPEPTTERMLPEFRPAYANYNFKAAMCQFDYGKIVALNLRWMRLPKGVLPACSVSLVEARAEEETALSNPGFTVGGGEVDFRATLRTGDYLEYWGEGVATTFDRNGFLLNTLTASGRPGPLVPGRNRVTGRAKGEAAGKLELITTGAGLRW